MQFYTMSHNKTAAYLSVSRWFCTAVVLLLHNLSYFKRNLSFRQGVSFFFYMNFAWIYFVFYIDFVIFFIIQFLYLHCQKSFCFYIAVSATLFVFWRIYSFTMVGSCSIAGIIFSTRSFVLSLRLDVLMHGWHPIYKLDPMSRTQ